MMRCFRSSYFLGWAVYLSAKVAVQWFRRSLRWLLSEADRVSANTDAFVLFGRSCPETVPLAPAGRLPLRPAVR